MLDHAGLGVQGKNVAMVGRSRIVGKPLAAMFVNRSATVTVCHSKTRDLKEECRRADIVVAAIGRARMIGADYIRDGAVVIDVGINRVDDNWSATWTSTRSWTRRAPSRPSPAASDR